MTLKEWREKQNLTQAEAAAGFSLVLGRRVQQAEWSRWENGIHTPRLRTADILSGFTGGKVSIHEIVRVSEAYRAIG